VNRFIRIVKKENSIVKVVDSSMNLFGSIVNNIVRIINLADKTVNEIESKVNFDLKLAFFDNRKIAAYQCVMCNPRTNTKNEIKCKTPKL